MGCDVHSRTTTKAANIARNDVIRPQQWPNYGAFRGENGRHRFHSCAKTEHEGRRTKNDSKVECLLGSEIKRDRETPDLATATKAIKSGRAESGGTPGRFLANVLHQVITLSIFF